MRVLILHPADRIPSDSKWDLVVDTARAPHATFEAWSELTGGRVLSVYNYAEEIADLYRTKNLLEMGLGRMLDDQGVDWWDVCSLMISPELQQLMLAKRVAAEFDASSEVHATRDSWFVRGLQAVTTNRVMIHRRSSVLDRMRSAAEAICKLDGNELLQVLQDKFDNRHLLRGCITGRPPETGSPVVLCPSAYVNVSHAVGSHAALWPEKQFYLVVARRSARINRLPANVRMAPLDGYFCRLNNDEFRSLLSAYEGLRGWLKSSSAEFLMADAAGVLDRMPSLLRWGLAVRDAWNEIFESENVVECFCADDSNPYTRIPLILAKKRRLPTLACHHGALDSRLAFKRSYADVHLVKSEMERDYTVRVCKVAESQVVLQSPAAPLNLQRPGYKRQDCLIFFTEAYHSAGFREEEVYRDLLPSLLDAAQALGLVVVIKLHPFDSLRKMKRYVSAMLSSSDRARVRIWDGVMTEERWQQARVAITGQSSVALESQAREIPTFLCGWLSDSLSGYQKQFVRYGVGTFLDSAFDLARIPELLSVRDTSVSQSPVRILPLSKKNGRLEDAEPVRATHA